MDSRAKPWRDPALPGGDCVQATDAQRQTLVEAEFGAYPTASFTDVPLDRNVSRVSVQSGTQHVLSAAAGAEVEGAGGKGRGDEGQRRDTLAYGDEKTGLPPPSEGEGEDREREIEEASKVEYVEPGWRGWLNCAGSVMVNMICCE